MLLVLICSLLVCVVFSAICSGAETGIYKISKVSLRINAEQGSKLSSMLNNLLQDTNSVIFSVLISNNVFNFLTTTIATAIIASHYDNDNAEYYATVFVTPLLFIFGELLPKNLFFIRADALMMVITLPLWAMHNILRLIGLTPLLVAVANGFAKIFGTPQNHSGISNIKNIVETISEETKHEGFFSNTQNEIIGRMVQLSNKTVDLVMIPLADVVMVDVNAREKELLKILANFTHTRILVYENHKSNIAGYLNIYKALNSPNIGKPAWHVRNFLKPIKQVAKETSVLKAIQIMKRDDIRIALVVRGNEKLGIITIKDLAEELTGELFVC